MIELSKNMREALAGFGLSLAATLGFEMIQFLYGIGEFDVDNVILNMLGALLGYVLACFACRLAEKWKDNKQFTESLTQSPP